MACALHRGACCTPVTWGTAILKRLGQHVGNAIREGRNHEQARWRPGFRAIPCARQGWHLEALTGFPREGTGVAEGRPGRLGRRRAWALTRPARGESPLPGLFDVDRIARAAFASVRVDDLDGQGVLSG